MQQSLLGWKPWQTFADLQARLKHGCVVFRALGAFLSDAPHTCLLPLLRLLLPLNCFPSHFPLCKSSNVLVITIRLVFCSAVCILQHVKQDTTHSKCIVHYGFSGGTESKGIRRERTLLVGEGKKDFMEVWGQDCPQEGGCPSRCSSVAGIQCM